MTVAQGTPRTDALMLKHSQMQGLATAYVAALELGRELERENAALSAQVATLETAAEYANKVADRWQLRATAAEAQVVELQKALRTIAEGEFDDLDPDDGLHGTSARAVAPDAAKVKDST